MAKKGQKTSADTRAKMAAAHTARWAKIREKIAASEACTATSKNEHDQHVTDNCHQRCNTVSWWSRIEAFVRGAR